MLRTQPLIHFFSDAPHLGKTVRSALSNSGFFISLQKLFSFSRKSNFTIFDFEISWRHQIPKHETRNTFYWITWEVNSLLMKFSQFMSYFKRNNFIIKFWKNWGLKTSSRPFCVCKELRTTSIGKLNFWINLLVLDM